MQEQGVQGVPEDKEAEEHKKDLELKNKRKKWNRATTEKEMEEQETRRWKKKQQQIEEQRQGDGWRKWKNRRQNGGDNRYH